MLGQLNSIINFIYPPQCYVCKASVLHINSICASCYNNLQEIGTNYCSGCGFSLNNYTVNNNYFINNSNNKLCLSCLHSGKIFNSFWYLYTYNSTIFSIINKFKYKDDTNLHNYLGNLLNLIQNKSNLLSMVDLVVPVPVSFKKLLKRKYNHSALLASYFAKANNLQYNALALKKIRHTQDQMKLNGAQRLQNVKGAFAINNKYANIIKNANILLIDDVVTTGSTVYECTKVLKKHKAKSVHILCLARVEGTLKV